MATQSFTTNVYTTLTTGKRPVCYTRPASYYEIILSPAELTAAAAELNKVVNRLRIATFPVDGATIRTQLANTCHRVFKLFGNVNGISKEDENRPRPRPEDLKKIVEAHLRDVVEFVEVLQEHKGKIVRREACVALDKVRKLFYVLM